MKVTTVRFGADLWGLLQDEAAHVGVSVSQYIREAALARAAAAAATRGEPHFELLARGLREVTEDENAAPSAGTSTRARPVTARLRTVDNDDADEQITRRTARERP